MNKQERAPGPGAGGTARLHSPVPGRSTQVQRIDVPGAGLGGPVPGRSTQVQRIPPSAAGAPGAGGAGAIEAAAGSSGAPLPARPRARFEASLGSDLGDVRVHDDAESHAAAAQLGARAFTVGRDIHFGAGQFQPDGPAGMHLLAHEVAHTVQQGGGAASVHAKLEVSQSGDASEIEADRFADHVVHGGAMPTLSLAPSSIQRQNLDNEGEPQTDEAFYDEITSIIEDVLNDYLNIPITVPMGPPPSPDETAAATEEPETAIDTVLIETPYWNNRYVLGELPAPEAYDELTRLSVVGTGTAPPEAVAKGTPEEIRAFVQQAVLDSRIPAPSDSVMFYSAYDPEVKKAAWEAAIELWMVQVGIGVDCNGLVYEALQRIEATRAATSAQARDNPARGALDNSDLTQTNAEVSAFGTGQLIPELELRPGDVMFIAPPEVNGSDGHVRIVMTVDPPDTTNRIIQFTTAESTEDGRSSAIGTNGPREHYWRWVDGQLYHRYAEPTDEDQVWEEDLTDPPPTYHRHFLSPSTPLAEGS